MSRRNANLIKSPEQIVQARVAAQLAADVLTMITPHVKPGVSTGYLDKLCNDYIVNVQQAIPANVGYGGFPATVCSSVNHVVCHGIPKDDHILKDGDIINLDVAVIKDGWHGDTSRMYYVGEPSKATRKLVETTYAAMWAGIRAVKPRATLGDVGFAIQTVAEKAGYSVVLDYCGHGIGMVYHDEPQVAHYGRPGQGVVLKAGMLFTIEPMINAGKAATKELNDGWTVETRDKSLSAQWEHMVLVTETGFEVLTLAPGETGAKSQIPNAVPAGVVSAA
ncbi:type I methionyl aminopeptidase [Duganella sp. BJB488]|uniref:type I methionyl aminopeptidase n=1 Tax=unclassified Duganella TaxID=2636909 RepID=UPI000E347A42|nr:MULTISPECIES: type I methionyl aminopeptidase [unclassified Duganella]RFP16891.1 type I methionyl aminopeptidase [Duganella sp. BJB489]RFP20691.1 type I methionyl aminopeptidase [Duganella sp. BJB488]RFP32254.1 type I methionyl aminopeptidase [Duganella sp. BJB480]